jgi:hypothetical protein
VSYAHIIREDPVRRGLLYLGTEGGLYVSSDDGEHWQSMQLGMPRAPVYGLIIQQHFNDLVVATYGRGFWILDDLSPLQKMTPAVTAANAHLFAPRPAYRFRDIVGNVATNDDPTAGTNPQYAAINYWLKSSSGNTPPTITILDAAGKTVRTIEGTTQAGLNRVYWDLRNEPTKSPRMRTKPLNNAEFTMAPDGTRPAPGFGTLSVLMPPGRYTVRLAAGGQTPTQPLEVRKDPNSPVTLADIQASANLLTSMQGDMNAATDMLNTIESVRAQIQSLGTQSATPADVKSAGDSVERKFMTVEGNLIDLRLSGRGQDEVRYPARLGAQLNYLAGGISASDFTPTTQQREVNQVLAKQGRDTRAALQALIQNDLAKFNALLRSKGLKTIDAGSVVF